MTFSLLSTSCLHKLPIDGHLVAARVPFTCIRPIPLSCALGISAFGLQVRVISRQYTNTNTNTNEQKDQSLVK